MNIKHNLETMTQQPLEQWLASIPANYQEAVRVGLDVLCSMGHYVADAGKHNSHMTADQKRAKLDDMRYRMGVMFAALAGSPEEEAAEAEDVGRARVKDAMNLLIGALTMFGQKKSREVIAANIYTAYWRLLDEENTISKEAGNA